MQSGDTILFHKIVGQQLYKLRFVSHPSRRVYIYFYVLTICIFRVIKFQGGNKVTAQFHFMFYYKKEKMKMVFRNILLNKFYKIFSQHICYQTFFIKSSEKNNMSNRRMQSNYFSTCYYFAHLHCYALSHAQPNKISYKKS